MSPRGLTIPPRYRDDLFGRISVLQEGGALANGWSFMLSVSSAIECPARRECLWIKTLSDETSRRFRGRLSAWGSSHRPPTSTEGQVVQQGQSD